MVLGPPGMDSACAGAGLEQHQQKTFSIAWKELYTIVIAAATRGLNEQENICFSTVTIMR